MAFSIAGFESVIDRTTKPFNPLLGETWEYDNGEVKIITEQVSHHPPISAGKNITKLSLRINTFNFGVILK
jgi:hypothetical protein